MHEKKNYSKFNFRKLKNIKKILNLYNTFKIKNREMKKKSSHNIEKTKFF